MKDAKREEKQKKESNYSNEFERKKERRNLRPYVVTPTLENASASQVYI